MQCEQPALVQQHAGACRAVGDPDRVIVARVAGAGLEADRAAVRDQVTRDAGRLEQRKPVASDRPIGARRRAVAGREVGTSASLISTSAPSPLSPASQAGSGIPDRGRHAQAMVEVAVRGIRSGGINPALLTRRSASSRWKCARLS
ncbi:hypothetical protein, partial [Thermomonas sp.]|uniref:hypothetical protein n=1 Tax=Thermomonas sp. TaxID=1971895 RepID=UPI0025D044AC